jgi:hypothetical protein
MNLYEQVNLSLVLASKIGKLTREEQDRGNVGPYDW